MPIYACQYWNVSDPGAPLYEHHWQEAGSFNDWIPGETPTVFAQIERRQCPKHQHASDNKEDSCNDESTETK